MKGAPEHGRRWTVFRHDLIRVRVPGKKSRYTPASACVLLFFVLAVAGCSRAPEPPAVELAAVDPAFGQTIHELRESVQASPQSADAWGKLGQALHAIELYPEATVCYRRAVELEPGSPRWLHLLGLVELQDAPDTALKHLNYAADLAGRQTDAPRFRLAQALVERGRFDEARSHLNALLEANPHHAAARLEIARICYARAELDQASEWLKPCLTNSYTLRPALFLMAQITSRQGNQEAAASFASRAASMPRQFDWPDPFLREVHSLRGGREKMQDQINSLLTRQRFREAEAVLETLFAEFPDDPEGWLLLGRLRLMERQCAEAEEPLRRSLAAQPASVNGWMQLSLALLCQQHWKEAAAALEQTIALKPDFAQAHYNLGIARARLGDSPGAIGSFRDALRCNPGDAAAHVALGEELFRAGERAEGLKHLDRALALNPNDLKANLLRARIQGR
jgi:tetratricopeptide (TPR) repeat protein